MVFHELAIDNVDHIIFIRTIKKRAFYGLSCALLKNLTDDQLKQITVTNRNKKNIIFFHDLINCFQDFGKIKNGLPTDCICGKTNITDLYCLRNKSNLEEYIIGSTCACNWFKEEKTVDECIYCFRKNKNGGNCINCVGKINLKSVFCKWKNDVLENKEKVTFGKFKGILTYNQLCNDTRNRSYIEWCLNESQIKNDVKKRLQYFADKHILA